MKKLITLMLVTGLVTTAAFAQDHRHSYDNSYNVNSYPNQYPSYNAYSKYGNNWQGRADYDQFGYRRHDRDRDRERRMIYRHARRNYNPYTTRSGLSLQLVIGNRRRF